MILRPNEDVTVTNFVNELNSATNIYTSINELSANDSTYISASTPSFFTANYTAGFSDPERPVADATTGSKNLPMVCSVRYRVTGRVDDTFNLTFGVRETGVAIPLKGSLTKTAANAATSFTTETFNVNLGVTSYTTLLFLITMNRSVVNTADSIVLDVSYVDLYVPDQQILVFGSQYLSAGGIILGN